MAKPSTQTKTTDSKGRVTLGKAFANRTLLVERQGDRIVLRLARLIPESEAWLYESPEALAVVRKGLQKAKAGELSDGPKLFRRRRAAKR